MADIASPDRTSRRGRKSLLQVFRDRRLWPLFGRRHGHLGFFAWRDARRLLQSRVDFYPMTDGPIGFDHRVERGLVDRAVRCDLAA